VRLLDRTSQGVEPTTYGLAFINCGTAVFDELRRGVQEIDFLSDPTVGELRVGAVSPLIDELIPAVVARLADRYPRIKFHVAENDTSTLCRLLHERRLDLAVGRASSSLLSEDVASAPLFEDPLLVVAGLNPATKFWLWFSILLYAGTFAYLLLRQRPVVQRLLRGDRSAELLSAGQRGSLVILLVIVSIGALMIFKPVP